LGWRGDADAEFACAYAQGIAGARAFRSAVSRTLSREEFLAVVADRFPRDPR
jgi:hypothetical protein